MQDAAVMQVPRSTPLDTVDQLFDWTSRALRDNQYCQASISIQNVRRNPAYQYSDVVFANFDAVMHAAFLSISDGSLDVRIEVKISQYVTLFISSHRFTDLPILLAFWSVTIWPMAIIQMPFLRDVEMRMPTT